MKNVSLIAKLQGETNGTSIDVTGRKYYPKYTSGDQSTRHILICRGYIVRDSMTLHHT